MNNLGRDQGELGRSKVEETEKAVEAKAGKPSTSESGSDDGKGEKKPDSASAPSRPAEPSLISTSSNPAGAPAGGRGGGGEVSGRMGGRGFGGEMPGRMGGRGGGGGEVSGRMGARMMTRNMGMRHVTTRFVLDDDDDDEEEEEDDGKKDKKSSPAKEKSGEKKKTGSELEETEAEKDKGSNEKGKAGGDEKDKAGGDEKEKAGGEEDKVPERKLEKDSGATESARMLSRDIGMRNVTKKFVLSEDSEENEDGDKGEDAGKEVGASGRTLVRDVGRRNVSMKQVLGEEAPVAETDEKGKKKQQKGSSGTRRFGLFGRHSDHNNKKEKDKDKKKKRHSSEIKTSRLVMDKTAAAQPQTKGTQPAPENKKPSKKGKRIYVMGTALQFVTADDTLICLLACIVAMYPTFNRFGLVIKNQIPFVVVRVWLLVAFLAGRAVTTWTISRREEREISKKKKSLAKAAAARSKGRSHVARDEVSGVIEEPDPDRRHALLATALSVQDVLEVRFSNADNLPIGKASILDRLWDRKHKKKAPKPAPRESKTVAIIDEPVDLSKTDAESSTTAPDSLEFRLDPEQKSMSTLTLGGAERSEWEEATDISKGDKSAPIKSQLLYNMRIRKRRMERRAAATSDAAKNLATADSSDELTDKDEEGEARARSPSKIGRFDQDESVTFSLEEYEIQPMFKLRGMDVFRTEDAEDCIATHPWMIAQGLRDVPTFILNIMTQWGNILVYLEMPSWAKKWNPGPDGDTSSSIHISKSDPDDVKAFKKFLNSSDQYRTETLRFFPSVVAAPPALKLIAPKKKVIGIVAPATWHKFGAETGPEGKKLMPAIECAIDCMATSGFRTMASMVKRKAHRLVLDVAMAIIKPEEQAENAESDSGSKDASNEEVEACLGMWRFDRISVRNCHPFPDRYDQNETDGEDPDVARANDIVKPKEPASETQG